jgi:hypothetical protein
LGGALTDEDQEAILEELEQLESEAVKEQTEQLPKVPQDNITENHKTQQVASLPDVPTQVLDNEEEEMEAETERIRVAA